MATVEKLTRTYKFKNMTLQDPNPSFTDDQVKSYYLGSYPDLLNTKISVVKKDGKETREFMPKVGTHG